MKTYLVGGAVRDRLLGLAVNDRDWVVVGATPDTLLNAGYRPVGKEFPVFLHPDTQEEYALARSERKQGHGYGGFSFNTESTITLEQDLERRDLTINAIAQTDSGELIDPFGGQHDLEARVLRHVSPAFVEDPLRVLRIARLAAQLSRFGFEIADETYTLMQTMVHSGELNYLTPERVWQEWHRSLDTLQPSRFITVLRACGALKVLFPELDALFGVPQAIDLHPEIDVGVHTGMVLNAAATLNLPLETRFAALLHDLGKGTTQSSDWPKHPEHEIRGVALVEVLCTRYRVPKLYRELAILVCKEHGNCHQALSDNAEDLLSLLERADAFRRPERFEQLLLAATADSHGRLGYAGSEYPPAKYLKKVFEQTQTITAAPLIRAGLQGKDLANALRNYRLAFLEKVYYSKKR